jgi:hypothetical protein
MSQPGNPPHRRTRNFPWEKKPSLPESVTPEQSESLQFASNAIDPITSGDSPTRRLADRLTG